MEEFRGCVRLRWSYGHIWSVSELSFQANLLPMMKDHPKLVGTRSRDLNKLVGRGAGGGAIETTGMSGGIPKHTSQKMSAESPLQPDNEYILLMA